MAKEKIKETETKPKEKEIKKDILDDLIANVYESSKKLSDYEEGDSEYEVKDYFDTGHILLNCQISARWDGGCPDNKILMMAGAEASGKSYIMKNIISDAINRCGYKVLYFDTEGELRTEDLSNHGIPADKVLVPKPPVRKGKDGDNLLMWDTTSLKNKWIQTINYLKPDSKIMFVLDSLSNLPSSKEISDSLEDSDAEDMGRRNKQLKSMFRSISSPASTKRIPIVMISHVYKTIGLFSSIEISSGTGAKYNASITPLFTPTIIKEGEDNIGINVRSFVKKNRLAKPFTTINYEIYFDGGLDRYSGLEEYAVKFGIIETVNAGSKGKCYVVDKDVDNKIPLKDLKSDKKAYSEFWQMLLKNGFGEKLNNYFKFSTGE